MRCVLQRKNNDCGAAAVASLTGKTYEEVEQAWQEVFGNAPKASSYRDLLAVLSFMGFNAHKVTKTSQGIRRVRSEPRCNHSHWVVICGDALWCPTSGWYEPIASYPWKHYGHGIEIL